MILIAIFAIYVIVTKRLRITRSTTVTGENARNFGIALLVLTIPFSLAVGTALRILLPPAARVWPIPQALYVALYAGAVLAMAYSFRDAPAGALVPASLTPTPDAPGDSASASEELKMTGLPTGTLPSREEFLSQARHQFEFLEREFGFREEPIPFGENRYLNNYAVWFASATTRVVVEGINYGMNARVALGHAGSVASFEDFDLGDLLAIRRPGPSPSGPGGDCPEEGDQIAQLRYYATALRDAASDVLRGDHAIFPELAARVEWRRAEFAAGRDPRS